MNLGDFIDFDRQLHLDPCGENVQQRRERDRRIGRELTVAGESAANGEEKLLLEWKEGVSSSADCSLGTVMEGAVRWTAFLLVAIGLLTGASAAAALLRYDGTQPINVLFFLGAIVGLQLLLLPLLIFSFIFRSRLRHGFRIARSLIGALLNQVLLLLARFGTSPEQTAKLRGELGALRAKNSLYARVQPLLILILIQVFGVAFNFAVAATLLFFVMFSDLTFSWGTTVQVEPEQIHRITSVLSAPWAGLVPQARPSLELVEATRFVRMDGAFATAAPDAALRAGGWWPFLLASTITYGLLPRLLAFVGSLVILRSEMRRVISRSSEVQALKERLRTPLVTVDSDSTKEAITTPDIPQETRQLEVVEKGLRLAVIFWAYDELPPENAISQLLQGKLGAITVSQFSAGGISAREESVLAQVTQAKSEHQIQGAAVFFEPFEPPKADARRFLTRLRETLGPSAPIIVFLAEFVGDQIAPVEQEDWNAWKHAIGAMGDPYLMIGERGGAS